MLSTPRAASTSASGGRQRSRFHARSRSSATFGSTPRHNRCPASEASVLLRLPSTTPSRTRPRRCSRPPPAAAVSPQIDARCEPGAVGHAPARMREIQVPSAAAAFRLYRARERSVLDLQPRETLVTAVARVDVEHHEIRYRARHDAEIELAPGAEPRLDLAGARQPRLVDLPWHDRALAARLDRNYRPAARQQGLRGGTRIRRFQPLLPIVHDGNRAALLRRAIDLRQAVRSLKIRTAATAASGSASPIAVAPRSRKPTSL